VPEECALETKALALPPRVAKAAEGRVKHVGCQ
jgi:hypothetical protein